MEKIRAQLIMEVLGKPSEYVGEVLEKLKNDISQEKGVSLMSYNFGEPRGVKDSDFFTGFLDIEVEVDKVEILIGMCFNYMPAHIDLIYPENISFSNSQLNELLNYLTTRLHGYDEVARVLQVQNERMAMELKELKDKN